MEEDISGIYNDDGTKINPETVPTPSLCLTCLKHDDSGVEAMLCLLNRNDQRDETDFKCGAYEPKY